MSRFAGIYAPIVTPFHADETLDEAGLWRNVARLMADTPLTGLVVLGSNGEAVQLDEDETDRVIATARDAVPRGRPLIAGVGRESTRATIAAARRAAAIGVDAVIVRTPSFFKPQMNADVFVRHYLDVADASPVPILLYNVTMFTGVNLEPAAVDRLASHPNIAGMKESGSDIGQIAEFCEIAARVRAAATAEASPASSEFVVLAGSATTLVHAFAAGCDGAVVALAGVVPDDVVRLFTLMRENKLEEARQLQRRLLPLARSVGSGFGVPGLKAALELLGFAAGPPRRPLQPASADMVSAVRRQLDAFAGDHAHPAGPGPQLLHN